MLSSALTSSTGLVKPAKSDLSLVMHIEAQESHAPLHVLFIMMSDVRIITRSLKDIWNSVEFFTIGLCWTHVGVVTFLLTALLCGEMLVG